jgi:hypothetical protein
MKDMKALCDQVLINFGSYRFEIRKLAWSESSRERKPGIVSFLFSAFFAFFTVK